MNRKRNNKCRRKAGTVEARMRQEPYQVLGNHAITSVKITAFQRQVLNVFPAGNKRAKSTCDQLSFFVIRKSLRIESRQSVKNLHAAIRSLIHKGFLARKDIDIYCITAKGIQFKLQTDNH